MTSVLKRFAFLAVIVSGAFLIPVSVYAEAVATIEHVQGEVFIRQAVGATDSWTPIMANAALNDGDSVKTKNGSCMLVYSDQGSFNLSSNTTITLQEKTEAKNILLALGSLKAKVNKDKVVKPFQVVTPTAVGAVRGTEVDFGFDENGQLTVDLHNGNVLVYNDEAEMKVDLDGGKKIIIKYDAESGVLNIQNDCSSNGQVTFSVQGTEYAENPCDKKEVTLETAGGPNPSPNPPNPDKPETPDTHNDPPGDVSPT